MISKAAIAAFTSRQLASWDWLKSQSEAELNRALAQPHLNDLWPHQKVGLLIALELKRFMFHMDMGSGKSRLTLELIKLRKLKGEKPRAIVFVPYLTAVETWVEQVKTHTPDLICVPLLGTGQQNLAALGNDGDLFVICYQSAVAMVSEKEVPHQESVQAGRSKQPRSRSRGSGARSWVLRPDVAELFSSFDTLICDEIHKAKGRNTLTFEMLKVISSNCPWAFGLTGTPFGRDLQDLWPQFYLIDFGETLGRTISFYREVFFNKKVNHWGGYEYTFKKPMFPLLQRMIKNCSIHYGMSELVQPPDKLYVFKTVTIDDGALGYCKIAIEKMNEAIKGKDKGAYQIIEQKYMQLRQLSSGFMTLKGDDIQKTQIEFDQNPKLEALAELVESVPSDRKIVIFHHFVFSSFMISGLLNKMGFAHARIWGGQTDPIGELRRFKEEQECRILVLNWRSGSSSLNLQNANYMVVFEQPDSSIDRIQGEARLWRPGQKERVFIYDLIAHGTLDESLHKANKRGKDLLKELLSPMDST